LYQELKSPSNPRSGSVWPPSPQNKPNNIPI
jgi:hypothetical protein